MLARNSDFLTETEKLNMNCIYKFRDGHHDFLGNTTAFVEMEDGINQKGLAIGLTSIYPQELGYGLNAGMLLRYGLEKCSSVDDFIETLKQIPIASSQTFTTVDGTGKAAVIECNAEKVAVCYADKEKQFVSAVNAFMLDDMETYRVKGIDDWNAEERCQTIAKAFGQERTKEPTAFAMDVLSGKYGFICQYDRKTGKDTVWSVLYDVGDRKIYRCEGNPSRKKYVQDSRLVF